MPSLKYILLSFLLILGIIVFITFITVFPIIGVSILSIIGLCIVVGGLAIMLQDIFED